MTARVIDFPQQVEEQVQIFSYPAGESQVRLCPGYINRVAKAHLVTIRARLTDHGERGLHRNLIDLLLLANAIHGVNPGVAVDVRLPYLPYSRGDRRFVDGDCLGLAVMGTLLQSGHFREIRTCDVHHRDRALAHIPGLRNVVPTPLIRRAIQDFAVVTQSSHVTVILPDTGAAERYLAEQRVVDMQHVNFVTVTKKRHAATGKLEGFDVPTQSIGTVALIVDDLCDGGGTFIGIADTVQRACRDHRRLGLYVSHGIFSQGLAALSARFEKIYTTNSVYPLVGNEQLQVWDAFTALEIEEDQG